MSGKLLRLPGRGRLLVSTDLQGNLRDFRALTRIFERRIEEGEDLHLLFTGDMVHGPTIDEAHWPAYLGTFYRDESVELVEALIDLTARNEHRVHCLLGNHEHGHVGGPHTSKFWDDEVAHLEAVAGPSRALRLRTFFEKLPLVALAPCGIVFTHGAPSAQIESAEEIEQVEYAGHADKYFEVLSVPVLGQVLWSRWAEPEAARAFANALGANVCLYGHDVVPHGFERIGDEQLIFSTSYGLQDSAKVYVELDLAATYRSASDLREGEELKLLYPPAARSSL